MRRFSILLFCCVVGGLACVALWPAWAQVSPLPTGPNSPIITQDLPTPADVGVTLPERDYTPAEIRLLQELDTQRINLLRREQALDLRERLVDLAEERFSQKVAELQNLQTALKQLLQNVSDKEEAELAQLARIYENMKPDAAAQILNKLDNAIVYDVFRRMGEKKSAKILEQMAAPKARFLSEMLAEPKDLPALTPPDAAPL